MYIQLNLGLILNRRKTTFIILHRTEFFTYSRVFWWGPFVTGVCKILKLVKLYSALGYGIIWNNKMWRGLRKKTLFSPANDWEEIKRLLETSPSFILFHLRSPNYSIWFSDLSSFQIFLSGMSWVPWVPVFFAEVTKPSWGLVGEQATLEAEYRVKAVLVICLIFTSRCLAAQQAEWEMHIKKPAESVWNVIFD